jgi:hypothetical protein
VLDLSLFVVLFVALAAAGSEYEGPGEGADEDGFSQHRQRFGPLGTVAELP